MKQLSIYIALILSFSYLGCTSNKEIVGTYHSNFELNSFYKTELKLNSDSTLKYRFSGDVINDIATGKYSLVGNKIYITYDTLKLNPVFDTTLKEFGIKQSPYYDELSKIKSRPQIFIVKSQKLFFTDSLGGIMKKQRHFSKGKYSLKKFYLEQ